MSSGWLVVAEISVVLFSCQFETDRAVEVKGEVEMTMFTPKRLIRAADNLVTRHFAVGSGESVLITADTNTQAALVQAVANLCAGESANSKQCLDRPRVLDAASMLNAVRNFSVDGRHYPPFLMPSVASLALRLLLNTSFPVGIRQSSEWNLKVQTREQLILSD